MRGYVWDSFYGGALLFQAVLRFIMFIYAAETIGMDEYNHWPIIIAFSGYSVIMGRGVLPYLAIELPALNGRGEIDKLFLVFFHARKKVAKDWVVAILISTLFFFFDEYNFISLGILIAISWSAYQLQVKIFRAMDEIKPLFFSIILGSCVFSLSGLYFIKTGITELFFCYFISLLAQTLFLHWKSRMLFTFGVDESDIEYKKTDSKLKYMTSVFLFSILSTFDRWLALFTINDSSNFYSVVVFSMMIGFLILTIGSQIIEPKIYRQYASGNPRKILSVYSGLLLILFSIGLCVIYLLLYRFELPFIKNIYYVKDDFINSFLLFFFIIPGVVFSSALKSRKMISKVNWNTFLSILVGVSCFFCMFIFNSPDKDIINIQAAIFFCYFTYSVFQYISYRKLFKRYES